MEFESADPSVVRSIKQREFLNAWLRAAAKHRPLPLVTQAPGLFDFNGAGHRQQGRIL
jgi:hypothetical protein